jgi:hypothetical protein
MPSYCCFCCPAGTYNDNALTDPCPSCGRPFGFPLAQAPAEIGDYKILRPLGRGFYAATYVAEQKTGLRMALRHTIVRGVLYPERELVSQFFQAPAQATK